MRRAIVSFVLAVCALAIVTLASPRAAFAHKPSDSYLTLRVDGATVVGRWDIALRDLEYVLELDGDGDGAITWGELHRRHGDIAQLAVASLHARADGAPCRFEPGAQRVATHSDGAYTSLAFTLFCAVAPRALDLDYALFFDGDPQHRGLARIEYGGATRALTFTATARTQRVSVELGAPAFGEQLGAFVRLGVHHIWEGLDHLAFLIALLLPSVLRRDGRDGSRWEPVATLRPALVDVAKIVTAFSVAHSITLSLSALGVVRLPSQLVEVSIAVSVVLAALNNVVPVIRHDRWFAAFALGLLHGFGFSATLMDLELPRDTLVATLFGFNLGVEVGQLAVVAFLVPLAFFARRTRAYTRFALVGGSLAIAALGVAWTIERAWGVQIFS